MTTALDGFDSRQRSFGAESSPGMPRLQTFHASDHVGLQATPSSDIISSSANFSPEKYETVSSQIGTRREQLRTPLLNLQMMMDGGNAHPPSTGGNRSPTTTSRQQQKRRSGEQQRGTMPVPRILRSTHEDLEGRSSLGVLNASLVASYGFLQERLEAVYNAFRIDPSGRCKQVCISAKELVADARLVPRDLIFLQLSMFTMPEMSNASDGQPLPLERQVTAVKQGYQTTGLTEHEPAPCIRPRKRSIIIVFGAFRGVILDDHAYFFCKFGSEGYRYDAILRLSRALIGLIEMSDAAERAEDESLSMPFWLRCLEEVLKDVCNGCFRQLGLISNLVERKLSMFENAGDMDRILALFGPLRDGINDYDAKIDRMIDVLAADDLEEDLSGFTPEIQRARSPSKYGMDVDTIAGKKAAAKAKAPPVFTHDALQSVVEVVIETYLNQFLGIQHGSQRLQSRLATAETVADLSLDVRRNQLARMQNHLEIAGLALIFPTLVAGLFGMNVKLPFGLDLNAAKTFGNDIGFWLIIFLCISCSALMYYKIREYMLDPERSAMDML